MLHVACGGRWMSLQKAIRKRGTLRNGATSDARPDDVSASVVEPEKLDDEWTVSIMIARPKKERIQ